MSQENLIYDARDFFQKPFERVERGRLLKSPDLDLLRWLPTLSDEHGLSYGDGSWFAIKGSRLGIPAYAVPNDSQIFIHSHYQLPDDDGSTPGLHDLLVANPQRQEWITSEKGMTRYWALQESWQRHMVEIEAARTRQVYTSKNVDEYVEFLASLKVRFDVYPWEKLSDQKLENLFHGFLPSQG